MTVNTGYFVTWPNLREIRGIVVLIAFETIQESM